MLSDSKQGIYQITPLIAWSVLHDYGHDALECGLLEALS